MSIPRTGGKIVKKFTVGENIDCKDKKISMAFDQVLSPMMVGSSSIIGSTFLTV